MWLKLEHGLLCLNNLCFLEFQELMVCLAYPVKRLEETQAEYYYKYFGELPWDEVYKTFRKDVAICLGIPLIPPLAVV